MISDEDRRRIAEHVKTLRIAEWAPLNSAERDLVRRALAPEPPADAGQHDAA